MEHQPSKSLHHTQKIGFGLLTLFAVCVLVLGGYQFRSTIYGPFALAPSNTDSDLLAIEDLFDDEGVRLQRIDTDQDGLNDYEELNFYNTSPYIADTDSDGIDDKTEIDNGQDPTCPSGGDCALYNPTDVTAETDTSVGTSALLEESLEASETLFGAISDIASSTNSNVQSTTNEQEIDFSALPEETQALINALISDPEAIRDLLRQSGTLSESDIMAFTDEELVATAIEVLNEN